MGVAQAKLAREVGCSPSYLNLIEHNKRRIGGKTLVRIAAVLGVSTRSLSQGADQALLKVLTEASAHPSKPPAERERVEEFIGRFPGWAALLGYLSDQIQKQEQNLLALSDRLAHDPFLGESMHLMLSNITAIRATASILARNQDIPEAQQHRFKENLFAESRRLSATASELVTYLDSPGEKTPQAGGAQSQIETYLIARSYYLPELEQGPLGAGADAKTIPEAGLDITKMLQEYRDMADRLPINSFVATAKACHFNPLEIARKLDQPLRDVLRRLAHLPPDRDIPHIGILQCDGSGAVLFRKELPGLRLPQYSSACPLWPIYRISGHVGQLFKIVIETVNTEKFVTYSLAYQVEEAEINLPPLVHNIMVFWSLKDQPNDEALLTWRSVIPVGLHCSVCARKTCHSRRSPYLLPGSET